MQRKVEVGSLNAFVKAAQYAVRGKIVIKSQELEKALHKADHGLPFKKIVPCNIGNPHALNQKAVSFVRNVLSLVVNPDLAQQMEFPADAVARAQRYLAGIPGVGAYSESQGILAVREDICNFLAQRDGYKADPASIFVTNGASEGVRLCMQTIMRDATSGFKDGILTPIPQYPLYSALTTLLQGHLIPYFLDESTNWSCSAPMLSAALEKATADGITPRGLVVINPGNPTGQVLPEENMREIVAWCKQEGICLMADEVYQENVWKAGAKFTSFRKVAYDMGAFDGDSPLQLVSFHSISKGFLGECGLRGGYFELLGFPGDVKDEILKLASISLCSNTVGQIAVGLMVQPPTEGQPSFEKFNTERGSILSSLRNRAQTVSAALNKMEGVSCNEIEGALYAFPTITLPESAVAAAKEKGMAPDAMYCEELLDSTGIVIVPGSGFGQAAGTFHFRTTILPPEEEMEAVTKLLAEFHTKFLAKYA